MEMAISKVYPPILDSILSASRIAPALRGLAELPNYSVLHIIYIAVYSLNPLDAWVVVNNSSLLVDLYEADR